MPKVSKVALVHQLLILALITQALAGILLPNAAYKTRRLSRRAIDSASTKTKSIENDRDIAAITASDQSDEERSLKVKSSQEGDVTANTNSGESESTAAVKSTKLLPALSNNHATINTEHKSSGKLLLNQVESQSDEEVRESNEHKTVTKGLTSTERRDVGTKEQQKKVERIDVSTESLQPSGKNEKHKEERDEQSPTQAPNVFSHAKATLQKPHSSVDTHKHIDNGLDAIELKAHAERKEDVENVDLKDEPPATTEEILKDLEEVGLKLTETKIDNEAKSENMKENNILMGRGMDGAQSGENKLEEYFREKLFKEEALSNKTIREEQKTETLEKPMTATGIKLKEDNAAEDAVEVAATFERKKIQNLEANNDKLERVKYVAEKQLSNKPEKERQSLPTNTEAGVLETTPKIATARTAATKAVPKVQEAATRKASLQAKGTTAPNAQDTVSTETTSEAQETATHEATSKAQEIATHEATSKAQETATLEATLKVQETAAPKTLLDAQEAATPSAVSQAHKLPIEKPNNKNYNSPAEKRAKFISENTTNSRNMNLPDGSVAWSLAAMKMVPNEMNNTNTDQDNIDKRWQMNEIVTTERTMNISDFSEKNLLDWTKVMGMRGELEEALGTMEKNHLTEGIEMNEKAMKNKEAGAQTQVDAYESEPKTQLTTEGIAMLKDNGPTAATTHIMNEIDINAFTTKTTVPSESPLSADKSDKDVDFIDTAITAGRADESPLNKSLSAPASSSIPAYTATATKAPALASSTETFTLSVQQTEHTGGAAQQVSTTQESKIQNKSSVYFNFIVMSTTPLDLLEETADVETTMSTVYETDVTTTTLATPTIPTALPVEHSSSTTTTTTTSISTPSNVEATKRWENVATTEMKAQYDKMNMTEAPVLLLSSDVSEGTKVDVNSKSNNSVHDVTLEQHLKREPETVVETQTEKVEQNTLLTVSELKFSKAYGSNGADERKLLNINASARENGGTVEDIEATTTIRNESVNVAKETTTESTTHITTTKFNLINTPTTLLSSTDLVDRNISTNKTSEVQIVTAKATETLTTTEVSQIGNEVQLEVRTTETSIGAAKEQAGVVKRPTDAVQTTTEATVGPTDVETEASKLNTDTGSSADKVLDGVTVTANDEPKTTEKTLLPISELLIPVNATTTLASTSTLPIATPPTQQTAVEPVLYTATTPKSDENINEQKAPLLTTTTTTPIEQPSGSVDGNSAAASTTTSTPVDFLPNHAAEEKGAHDTESSIETNVIDQVDKKIIVNISDTNESRADTSTINGAVAETTTKEGVEAKETTAGIPTSDVLDVNHESTQDEVIAGRANTETATNNITTSRSIGMASVPSNAEYTPTSEDSNNTNIGTTTTEPPLINLLDNLTTTKSKSPTSMPAYEPSTTTTSIGVNPHEVYTLFTSTESTINVNTSTTLETTSPSSTTTITSTAAITPQVPKETTTTEDTTSSTDTKLVSSSTTTALPPAYIPSIASTIATVTTTMLPPPTLHASIGGSGSSNAIPTHLINAGIRPSSNNANETDVNVIIAITVSVIGVVALILLVAFLYLMRKRQKQMSYGQRCRPVSLDAYSLDNVSVLGSMRRRKGILRTSKRSYGNIAFDDPSLCHNVLNANELAKFVERRSSIFEEFRDVPQIIARADEIPPGCEDKNRYANVIPLPETRVVLQQLGDDDKTEYINANYVRGPKDAPNYYIATQAPLETTVTDFWRMIWEQQSRVIIQATDLYENGIERCAEYLPPSVTLDNHTTYGDFQITLKHREVKDKYAISTLMLKNTAENISRELTHYWYKWPETGVPNEEAPIIAMLLEARSSLKGYVNEAREKSSNVTLKSDANGEVTTNGNGVTAIAVEGMTEMGGRVNGVVTNDNVANTEINGNISAADKMKSTTLRNQGNAKNKSPLLITSNGIEGLRFPYLLPKDLEKDYIRYDPNQGESIPGGGNANSTNLPCRRMSSQKKIVIHFD
ncbi:mucin-22 isoform X2 [Eurosta solidaginis]|uniref:mucin-22 isoform X2 n=1 Tax=Eurosta solidaginis TaxID=178769 RepID=UPI0035308704